MKIEIIEETKKEIEITLPAYYSWGNSYYKIISEKEFIEVISRTPLFDEVGIKQKASKGFIPDVLRQGKKITAKTFEEEYKKAISELITISPYELWQLEHKGNIIPESVPHEEPEEYEERNYSGII